MTYGAGTTRAMGAPPYVPGPLRRAGLTIVEGPALDEEYPCRLWLTSGGLIHEYQSDSSSKLPAPELPDTKM
jgi:hypothetical protein